ncbi:MAG: transposase [Bacteroidota bacterium]
MHPLSLMSKDQRQANKPQSKLRPSRVFSDTFKRQRVKEIEQCLYTVTEVSRLYEVSPQSVYRWLYKYSVHHQKGVRQVIEMKSEENKTKALLKRVAELERAVGQKQLQIDYLEQLIDIGSEELNVDLKKNFDTKFWPTSTASSKKKDSK